MRRWVTLAAALWLACGAGAACAGGVRSSWDDLASPLFSHIGPAEGLPYPVGMSLAQGSSVHAYAGTTILAVD